MTNIDQIISSVPQGMGSALAFPQHGVIYVKATGGIVNAGETLVLLVIRSEKCVVFDSYSI